MADVVLVRWPDESERLETLRSAGTPRLLLVAADEAPPVTVDPLEDWVRLPADEAEIRARLATLSSRAGNDQPTPAVDADGLLHYGDRWVALSPVEQALAAVLTERFGAVVGRDVLARRAWPDGVPTRNALDVHVLRIRRRIAGLGLELRTVRSRGYLLQSVATDGH
ncbi:MAG TPA: helix-turn-helix domain-containing protein [Acidimicrobiia bacterium]|nr:helix-turn-helix domain-containing protein [Acidimicrobiia bacterium]